MFRRGRGVRLTREERERLARRAAVRAAVYIALLAVLLYFIFRPTSLTFMRSWFYR